jgi:hypothetical protein
MGSIAAAGCTFLFLSPPPFHSRDGFGLELECVLRKKKADVIAVEARPRESPPAVEAAASEERGRRRESRADQGEQMGECSPIGRLFILGIFFENYRSSPNFLSTFYDGKNGVIFLTKSKLGCILGGFFPETHLVTQARTALEQTGL